MTGQHVIKSHYILPDVDEGVLCKPSAVGGSPVPPWKCKKCLTKMRWIHEQWHVRPVWDEACRPKTGEVLRWGGVLFCVSKRTALNVCNILHAPTRFASLHSQGSVWQIHPRAPQLARWDVLKAAALLSSQTMLANRGTTG